MSSSGWYGIDLDGTLAHYEGWKGAGHIGKPVPKMLEQVKAWLNAGITCKIFTARIAVGDPVLKATIIKEIHDWLEENGLPRLEVTNVKDFSMVALFDDRAYHVIPNTGNIEGTGW